MSRTAKLIAATVIYGVMMYGAYLFAVWGAEHLGIWTLAIVLPIALAGGLWFDHRDKQRNHRA